jgi:hypothetical protein
MIPLGAVPEVDGVRKDSILTWILCGALVSRFIWSDRIVLN